MLHWLIATLILAAGAPRPAPDDIARLELVGTSFSQPLYVTAPEGDPRLFVVERGGRVKLVAGNHLVGTYLDLRFLLPSPLGGEQGLLGPARRPRRAVLPSWLGAW